MTTTKKRKASKKKITLPASLQRVNLDAAGIDIGASFHYVAVPIDRDPQPVRRFEAFTAELYQLANWLAQCGIKTVAMESTGVYWIPLFQILESRGIEVKLVNARYVKNVPGRKSDILDCQWLQELHTYGLLAGSFRPANDICVLRSYLRHRDNLIKQAATHIHHMQKSLSEMNIQLQNVISEITGFTGMRIIHAILQGERDFCKLAELKHHTIKSSVEEIAKSLQGDYRAEHLFSLKQSLELYEFYREKIDQCDEEIVKQLRSFEQKVDLAQHPLAKPKRVKPQRNEPKFDIRTELYRISGVDLTKIPGISTLTAQTIIAEIGLDMSKWPTEKHFASWLGLSPNKEISGGKILRDRTRKVVNRATEALRMAAYNLKSSQSALGAYYRRLTARLDKPKAITAAAHKLARLVYRMLKYGQQYVDIGIDAYEQKYRDRLLKSVKKRAATLGYELAPKQTVNLVS
jgi:transposase